MRVGGRWRAAGGERDELERACANFNEASCCCARRQMLGARAASLYEDFAGAGNDALDFSAIIKTY